MALSMYVDQHRMTLMISEVATETIGRPRLDWTDSHLKEPIFVPPALALISSCSPSSYYRRAYCIAALRC